MAVAVSIGLNTVSTPDPETITVTLTVTNLDGSPVDIEPEPLIAPSVGLDVEQLLPGPVWAAVGMMPPPLPDPANNPVVTIPGLGTLDFVYDNFLGGLPIGTYRVRGHYQTLNPAPLGSTDEISSWVQFDVEPP